MRKFSAHPDSSGGLDVGLSSVRGGQDLMPEGAPGAVQKQSGLKQKFWIRDLRREDLVIIVLAILSAAVAAFIVFT